MLNAKLVGAILDLKLCILATTSTPNTKKDKRSIKSFVKEIEQEHVTKTISSYLSVKV